MKEYCKELKELLEKFDTLEDFSCDEGCCEDCPFYDWRNDMCMQVKIFENMIKYNMCK